MRPAPRWEGTRGAPGPRTTSYRPRPDTALLMRLVNVFTGVTMTTGATTGTTGGATVVTVVVTVAVARGSEAAPPTARIASSTAASFTFSVSASVLAAGPFFGTKLNCPARLSPVCRV